MYFSYSQPRSVQYSQPLISFQPGADSKCGRETAKQVMLQTEETEYY